MKTKRWILAYDLHYPKHNRSTWDALMDFISKNRVDGFLFGGDQLDNEEISHHNAGKPLYKPVGSYKKHTDGFARLLDEVELFTKKSERVWLTGNHDEWEKQIDETDPHLRGCLDRPTLLKLQKRGWQVVPNGLHYRLSKYLVAIHGDQLRGSMGYISNNAARSALQAYPGDNLIFGHTHTCQSFAQVSPVDVDHKRMAWNMPALCDLNPTFMKNRPSAWVHGFGIAEVRSDQSFNVYPIVVTKGRFSFNGVEYGSKS